MIEVIIKDYLDTVLTVPVYAQRPAEVPQKYVTVERTGGGMTNRIRSAMVAVQSYAPTLYEAAELHEEVIGAMLDIVSLDEIGGISLNSEYNYTDEETKQPRYQAVFDVVYY